jgi:hypothetical protein
MSDGNLKKFHAFCAKRPEVVTISDIKPVPSYNNDGDQVFFEMRILPTEKDYLRAFSFVNVKDKYWSCRLREIIKGQRRKDFDYLGVSEFLAPEETY